MNTCIDDSTDYDHNNPFTENKSQHWNQISVGECNTILSAYTKYRHLG